MKINREAIYWFCLAAIGLASAYLIVWFPFYFFSIVAGLSLLMILSWKTPESLVALIFYLPFQIALNISADIDLASSRILIAVFFVLWILKALVRKRVEIPHSATTFLILVFTGLAALSAVFSIEQGRSFVRLLYFLSIIPLYFVSAYYISSPAFIKKVFGVIAASGAAAAFFGIIQFFGQFIFGINPVMDFMANNIAPVFYGQSFSALVLANPSWLVNIGGGTYLRAISLFPDPHMFAFYLGLVIPPVLTLFLRASDFRFSRTGKTFIIVVNVLLFLALGFTFSRAGYVGAAFGIITVFALNWKFLDKKFKIAAAAVSLIVTMGFFSSPNLIVSRFFDVFNMTEGSNSERLANWTEALKIIEDHSLSGVGVGAYALAVDPRSSPRSSITAHNTYLDIAAEMGIGALLVWIAILAFATKELFRISRGKTAGAANGGETAALAAGLAGAFVWFSVQSFFDTAIYSPTLFALLMVYLAMAVNLGKREILT